jgi:hypothetical protein
LLLSFTLSQISLLYIPTDLGQNFDPSLTTFLIWPEALNGSVGESQLKFMESIAMKFRLNSEAYILFEEETESESELDPVSKSRTRTALYEFYYVGNVSIVQRVSSCWKSRHYDCYILSRLFHRRRDFRGGVVRATAVVGALHNTLALDLLDLRC